MTDTGSRRDPSAFPVLRVRDLDKEVEFIRAAFGAEIIAGEAGTTGERPSVRARVGDTEIRLEEAKGKGPGKQASIAVRVSDVDKSCRLAVEFGGTVIEKARQSSDGIRDATVEDPEGHLWRLTQMPGKLTTKDIERRLAAQRRSRM